MQILEPPRRVRESLRLWGMENGGDLALDAGRLVGNSLSQRLVPRAGIRWAAPSYLTEMIFPALWMFIGMVSSWDAYLTIKYQDHILYLERNPIGKLLLKLDGGQPSLFIGAKFLGTILVLGLLATVFRHNRRLGYLLVGSISTFQFGLLCYLALR